MATSYHLRAVVYAILCATAVVILILSPQIAVAQGVAIMPPTLAFVDLNGDKIESLQVGRQVMITVTFINYEENPKPFLGLFEVRDSGGVTQFIAWQSATMPASNSKTGDFGNSTIGVSWTANKPSTYEARVFAITGFNNMQILSPIQTFQIAAK